jgi:hypothetical protein
VPSSSVIGRCVSRNVGNYLQFVISAVRPDVHDICTLPSYYATLSGRSVPTFRDNLSVPCSRDKSKAFFLDFLALEDATDRLSRNVDTELALNSA